LHDDALRGVIINVAILQRQLPGRSELSVGKRFQIHLMQIFDELTIFSGDIAALDQRRLAFIGAGQREGATKAQQVRHLGFPGTNLFELPDVLNQRSIGPLNATELRAEGNFLFQMRRPDKI